MKKTIGIAGNILVDAVKKIECWPQRGMLVNINGVSHAIGGCVGNTAVDLKRLDEEMDVCVFGRIGKDEYGDYVLRVMREEGLDVSAVVRSDSLPTSFTDVMTLPGGERTFFHARGANAEFSEKDVGEKNAIFFISAIFFCWTNWIKRTKNTARKPPACSRGCAKTARKRVSTS